MDLRNTIYYTSLRKLCALCFITLFTSLSIYAQDLFQDPEKDKQMLNEIEQMREMIRQRKAQQEQQRKILQELQESVSGDNVVKASPTKNASGTSNPRTPVSTQNNVKNSNVSNLVTSGSELSQIEVQERLNQEIQKHQVEINAAHREIELLKKQLEIANKQLDNYRGSSQITPISTAEYNGDRYQSNQGSAIGRQSVQKTKPKKEAAKTSKSAKKQTREVQATSATVSDQQSTQFTEEQQRAMDEIEQMREMLRQRKIQQEQQRKIIQDMQQNN